MEWAVLAAVGLIVLAALVLPGLSASGNAVIQDGAGDIKEPAAMYNLIILFAAILILVLWRYRSELSRGNKG